MIPSGPGALSGFGLRSAAATSSFVIRMGQSGVCGYVYPTMSLRSASRGGGEERFLKHFRFLFEGIGYRIRVLGWLGGAFLGFL